tara:strand:+ start:421 stop:612 length:192 start_codon:yes stop_codon:yes gene_type:complete
LDIVGKDGKLVLTLFKQHHAGDQVIQKRADIPPSSYGSTGIWMLTERKLDALVKLLERTLFNN